MNTSLNALLIKLNAQKNDLTYELSACEAVSLHIKQQLVDLETTLNQSAKGSLLINPEFEINRLNFLTQEQDKKQALEIQLKQQQDLEARLLDKVLRIKTELKLLERYLEGNKQEEQRKQAHLQQQAMDEWVLQKGSS